MAMDDLARPDAFVVGGIDAATHWSTALRDVEVIVHCAARAHVMREHASDPLALYREVNVDGTRHLAEQAAALGVRRLIFLSSVKATAERSVLGRPISVSDTPRPEDAYGISKLEAERALAEVSAATGLEVLIVRPPLVYGPGVKGNFLRLLGLVARGLPLPLGLIDNARSMVYLDNLVDFLCTCVTSPAANGRTFFVSDGDDLSTTELIRKLASAMGRPARLLPVPTGVLEFVGRVTGKSAEVERLIGTLQVDITPNRELGWSPPFSVEAGLRETVKWFASQR
jgi:nucleoside-diphosphate-sugar epimerase